MGSWLAFEVVVGAAMTDKEVTARSKLGKNIKE
jgi:hypothetical protein